MARMLQAIQESNREDREYWEEVNRLDAEQA